jgi:predicted nucleic acid-binding protein
VTVTLDTNIFVYALNDTDDRQPAAISLVERASRAACVQPMQTFGELYTVLVGKYRRPPSEALTIVQAYRTLLRTTVALETDFDDAMRAAPTYRLQFWDAMIWATARRAGARVLLTEDMDDGRDLEGVRIVNPFIASNRSLVDLALSET